MRVLLLGNGPVAAHVAATIVQSGDTIVGFVAHPPERAVCRDEIIRSGRIDPQTVMLATDIFSPVGVGRIERLNAEIAVAVYFGYILPANVLCLFKGGAINLHVGLLPHNRGAYPNVWSIVERTPAGVTLHYMDEGIDTGDIIDQQHVEVEPVDTGETLYWKLQRAAEDLFARTWALLRTGQAGRTPQQGTGTSHKRRDVESIDRIDLERLYSGRELLDILRARTFRPHPGAYFEVGGRKVWVRVELEYAKESSEPDGRD